MTPQFFQLFTSQPLAIAERHFEGLVASMRNIIGKPGSAEGNAARTEPKEIRTITHDWLGNEIARPVTIDDTAIVPLRGVVAKGLGPRGEYWGFLDVDKFSEAVLAATEDPGVSRIVLSIDSPGGTVLGTRTAADAVFRAVQSRKEVYTYTDGLMASAAYYIGAASNRILAAPGSVVGSVGVFTYLVDFTAMYEDWGIKAVIIRSGDKKAIGAYGLDKLDDEKIAVVQEEVDSLGREFRGWVTAHRNIDMEHLQGQVYSGVESVVHNFADGVANSLHEALVRFNHQNQ